MHWAVRSKKEKMLEEPDPADTSNLTDEEGSQQKTTLKGLSSATERKEKGEPETLDKSWSLQSPDSSGDGRCQADMEARKIWVKVLLLAYPDLTIGPWTNQCSKPEVAKTLPVGSRTRLKCNWEICFPDGNCWHLCFRWSGDTPSWLLRKFRNYEI
ncbi:dnaJ homolog subfamily C member 12-like [Petaurus breviceps papuanus]|uniref:dnaJ homolog subfamily C member 12-like n=1 Tax=Petaurus breviceps papuanus TaxID=3040969 RepID=UPI0036D91AD8